MIETLGELNERFYKIYGRLHENRELLSSKQIDFISQCLFEQYKEEYNRLLLTSEIEERDELCRLEILHDNLIPRRGIFRSNKAYKLLQREMDIEINAQFDEREKQLDEREQTGFDTENEEDETDDVAEEDEGSEDGAGG